MKKKSYIFLRYLIPLSTCQKTQWQWCSFLTNFYQCVVAFKYTIEHDEISCVAAHPRLKAKVAQTGVLIASKFPVFWFSV